MAELHELEQLSRLVAGELSEEEARTFEDTLRARQDLREARELLAGVVRGAPELLDEVSAEQLDAWVSSSLNPAPTSRRFFKVLGAVAVLCALLLLGLIAQRGHGEVLRLADGVSVNDEALGEMRPVWGPAQVSTDVHGSAYVSYGSKAYLLSRNSMAIVERGRVVLEAGAVVVRGHDLAVEAGGRRFHVEGHAVFSTEPNTQFDRVTDRVAASDQGEDLMRWKVLGPAVAGVAVATGVALYVLDGKVAVAGPAPMELSAHQRWSSSAPATSSPTQVASAQPAAMVASSKLPSSEPSVNAPLESLTHAQLLARAKQLQQERDALARNKKTSSFPLMDSGFYRPTPEQTRSMAADGTFVMHPSFEGKAPTIPDDVQKQYGLTDAERQRLTDIYQHSSTRLKAGLESIYLSNGGDPAISASLSGFSLVQELQEKTGARGSGDWFNTVNAEQAGQQPVRPLSQQTPMEQVYRMLHQEDELVWKDVDALLGPERAQAILNAPGVSGSTWSFKMGSH